MSFTEIHGVFLADTARVIGDVTLGEKVSVWYSAAIRGDVASVKIGACSNVQDGAVVHCDSGEPNIIGERVVIGHCACVHGKAIGNGSLIGMQSTVLGQSVIGERCIIAAGAVVRPGMVVPDDHVVMGLPGKVVRETTDKEKDYMKWLAGHYAEMAEMYVRDPENPRFKPWNGNPAPGSVVHPETPDCLKS